MRDWVGYGAKYFANIVRFQAILKQMQELPTRSDGGLHV